MVKPVSGSLIGAKGEKPIHIFLQLTSRLEDKEEETPPPTNLPPALLPFMLVVEGELHGAQIILGMNKPSSSFLSSSFSVAVVVLLPVPFEVAEDEE